MSTSRLTLLSFVVIGLLLSAVSILGGGASGGVAQAAPSAPPVIKEDLSPPAKDSWVDQAASSSTHGYDAELRVGLAIGDEQTEREILIQYDLSVLPPSVTIITTTLQFYQTTAQGKAEYYVVWPEAIEELWNEATVNWINKPASGDVGEARSISRVNGVWQEVDVTKFAKK